MGVQCGEHDQGGGQDRPGRDPGSLAGAKTLSRHQFGAFHQLLGSEQAPQDRRHGEHHPQDLRERGKQQGHEPAQGRAFGKDLLGDGHHLIGEQEKPIEEEGPHEGDAPSAEDVSGQNGGHLGIQI